MNNKKFWNDWTLLILASLTLGLAPFYPEPHIWGKLKWLAGGAHGMQWLDWWDLIIHGAPWILLLRLVILRFVEYIFPKPEQ